MARTNTTKRQKPEKSEARRADAFQLREGEKPTREAESQVHVLGPGIVCDTEPRGHATPRGRSPREIVVDASEGFIPVWAKNMTLRWRFRERSMNDFANPAAAKSEIRNLFAEALLAWGTAAPVKFTEDEDVWDFEIVMRRGDDCNASGGCVLASAFFPDSGRHQLALYPKMFTQSRKEQMDTFIHEIGHIFGLRHFFANVSETAWPSEIFGTHSKFSIMNYGSLSELTAEDKDDLRRLYQLAWSGALTHINGTPIRLVKPFNTLAPAPDSMVAVGQIQTVLQPQSRVAYIGGM
jgi:matrixin